MGETAEPISRSIPVRKLCRRTQVAGRLSQGVRRLSAAVGALGCENGKQDKGEEFRAHLRCGAGEGQGVGGGAGSEMTLSTPNTETRRAQRTQRKPKGDRLLLGREIDGMGVREGASAASVFC